MRVRRNCKLRAEGGLRQDEPTDRPAVYDLPVERPGGKSGSHHFLLLPPRLNNSRPRGSPIAHYAQSMGIVVAAALPWVAVGNVRHQWNFLESAPIQDRKGRRGPANK